MTDRCKCLFVSLAPFHAPKPPPRVHGRRQGSHVSLQKLMRWQQPWTAGATASFSLLLSSLSSSLSLSRAFSSSPVSSSYSSSSPMSSPQHMGAPASFGQGYTPHSSSSGPNTPPARPPRKEILNYSAPWPVYGLDWSNQPAEREALRLAVGSFIEDGSNKVSTSSLLLSLDHAEGMPRPYGASISSCSHRVAIVTLVAQL